MKTLAIIFALLLTGCATFDGKLENRVTTTLACDRAFFTSLFGPVGITGEIDKRDLAQMPCAARDKKATPAVAAPAAPASAAK